jgi:hypothetical protein
MKKMIADKQAGSKAGKVDEYLATPGGAAYVVRTADDISAAARMARNCIMGVDSELSRPNIEAVALLRQADALSVKLERIGQKIAEAI